MIGPVVAEMAGNQHVKNSLTCKYSCSGEFWRVASTTWDLEPVEPAWPAKTLSWNIPADWGQKFETKPWRKGGRPAPRWDDHLTQFTVQHFGDEHWLLIAKRDSFLNMTEKHVEFCRQFLHD